MHQITNEPALSDLPVPEHFADWNEQMVQRYDPEIFHHHPRGVVRWVENKRVAAVLRGIDARPEHRILDVGCGAGNILAQLPGQQRTGVDLSPFMVRRATERLNGQATVAQGDAEQLPYPAATFDRVIATSLLSHTLHPDKVIDEICRVTKPGGRVVISISHEDKIERGLNLARSLRLTGLISSAPAEARVYNVEYHLHRFSPERLRQTVGTKLTQLHMLKVPFFFPVHWVGVYQR